ncbi:hypothetical protein [Hymenobacter lapidiphilus]|uniref:DUF3575 domain-containing protein n=1 Tax=Hymenobacter lapidiphilus TaxID=2608003 RepID=A0A7Y7PP58_9BACT|nr:hypothetical protein [Hymenobacter lapidiphilus]NVO31355.1 hypothetical protein [Hymenobacter lapidiphilus]
MKRLLGMGLLSLGLLAQARGQSGTAQQPGLPISDAPRRTWGLSVDWVPLLASGYHFSLERSLDRSGGRQTVVLTPQLYRGPVGELTSDRHQGNTDRVRGFGLAAQHRFYLGAHPTPLAGIYLAYGLAYQHFRLDFQSPSWQPELAADGLYYYQYGLRNQTETVDRYGATLVLGHQLEAPGSPFFLDVFLGLGLRQATSRTTTPSPQFATTSSDYGHAGAYLPVGFRLGLHL